MFLGQKNKKTMKLKNLRAIKTPVLRADDSQDNQYATTTQVKKIVKTAPFLGGGGM